MKFFKRYDKKGSKIEKLFNHGKNLIDLSETEIVGTSIDTIRQLFYGKPLEKTVNLFESLTSGEIIFFNGNEWHFTNMGKAARYRFKLQNNELGIIILFASYFAKLHSKGQHLKIELSPQFISSRSNNAIWDRLHQPKYGLSHLFLEKPKPKGCSVHLAVDWQGYRLPKDFLDHLSTRASTIKTFDGISELNLSNISEATVSYGKNTAKRNYMIGKAGGLQTVIYNKAIEIVKSDKVDYFHEQWRIQSGEVFNPKLNVYRLENRYHHSVIREIGEFLGKELESFEQIHNHLTDIWRYGLTRNRFDFKKNVMHPLWQLFYEDVIFLLPSQYINLKRMKKQSIDPEAKNITGFIGNYVALMARRGFTPKRIFRDIRGLSNYKLSIVPYYKQRGWTEKDLYKYIRKRVKEHLLIGKAS